MRVPKSALSLLKGRTGITLQRFREFPHAFVCFALYAWNVVILRRDLLLIERAHGLGDFICVLWSVKAVRERHRGAWTVLICPADCRKLANFTGLCDLATNAGNPFNGFIRAVSPKSSRYAPLNPDERVPPEPQANCHLADEAAKVMKVAADPFSVAFNLPSSLRRFAQGRLAGINPAGRPVVAIHVGPSWPVREWPMERWAKFTARMADAGIVVLQIGMDFDTYQGEVRRSRIPGAVDWVNQLDIAQMAAVLDQVDVYVGIDSGPQHIATTLGRPTVALFGPTDGRLRVHPRAQSIILDGRTDCLGCHHALTGPLHWRSGCPHDIACMKGITTDHVVQAVESLINRRQPEAGKTEAGRAAAPEVAG